MVRGGKYCYYFCLTAEKAVAQSGSTVCVLFTVAEELNSMLEVSSFRICISTCFLNATKYLRHYIVAEGESTWWLMSSIQLSMHTRMRLFSNIKHVLILSLTLVLCPVFIYGQ